MRGLHQGHTLSGRSPATAYGVPRGPAASERVKATTQTAVGVTLPVLPRSEAHRGEDECGRDVSAINALGLALLVQLLGRYGFAVTRSSCVTALPSRGGGAYRGTRTACGVQGPGGGCARHQKVRRQRGQLEYILGEAAHG